MTVVVFETVVDYLEKCGLIKTARVMRKELKVVKDVVLDRDREMNLLSNTQARIRLIFRRDDSGRGAEAREG